MKTQDELDAQAIGKELTQHMLEKRLCLVCEVPLTLQYYRLMYVCPCGLEYAMEWLAGFSTLKKGRVFISKVDRDKKQVEVKCQQPK